MNIAVCTISCDRYLTYGISTYLSMLQNTTYEFDFYHMVISELPEFEWDKFTLNDELRRRNFNYRFLTTSELSGFNSYRSFWKKHSGIDASTKKNAKGSYGYFNRADFLRWGSKPFLMSRLLSQNYDLVIYVDCDIIFVINYDSLVERCSKSSMCLTPQKHTDNNPFFPERFGYFNAGFVSVNDFGRPLEKWLKLCKSEISTNAGLFVDQKHLDVVALDHAIEVDIIRDPGYNVAGWNLGHKRMSRNRDGKIRILGQEAVFIHNSGNFLFNPKAPWYREMRWYRKKYRSFYTQAQSLSSSIGIDRDTQVDKTYQNTKK